jgi:hypothetical protein
VGGAVAIGTLQHITSIPRISSIAYPPYPPV